MKARRLFAVWLVMAFFALGGVQKAEAFRQSTNRGVQWDHALGFKP
jgi:hypothetical protein